MIVILGPALESLREKERKSRGGRQRLRLRLKLRLRLRQRQVNVYESKERLVVHTASSRTIKHLEEKQKVSWTKALPAL